MVFPSPLSSIVTRIMTAQYKNAYTLHDPNCPILTIFLLVTFEDRPLSQFIPLLQQSNLHFCFSHAQAPEGCAVLEGCSPLPAALAPGAAPRRAQGAVVGTPRVQPTPRPADAGERPDLLQVRKTNC